jgi:hypothetical protein
MTSFLLQTARDTSSYFHSAYIAIGVIILTYSFVLFSRTRKIKRGKNGQ